MTFGFQGSWYIVRQLNKGYISRILINFLIIQGCCLRVSFLREQQ